MKEAPVHKDVLGRDIRIGDCVAVSSYNSLAICKVTNLTPKMVRVHLINAKRASNGRLKRPEEMVVVPGEDVFVHVLTSVDKL